MPEDKLIVVWDGASYHRACMVREAAEALNIDLVPSPRDSSDSMPVEAPGAGSEGCHPIIIAILPPRI